MSKNMPKTNVIDVLATKCTGKQISGSMTKNRIVGGIMRQHQQN